LHERAQFSITANIVGIFSDMPTAAVGSLVTRQLLPQYNIKNWQNVEKNHRNGIGM
jgi:hypothetical protein